MRTAFNPLHSRMGTTFNKQTEGNNFAGTWEENPEWGLIHTITEKYVNYT